VPDREKTFKLYYLLAPLSLPYGLATGIRNRLFDCGILPSEEYPVPVISVGNLAAGGTGKTPHVEYIVELLGRERRIAVLSRGYGRRTKGFLLAGGNDNALTIGDEAYQLKRKYPDVTIAVDSRRRRGIRTLLELPDGRRPEVILLDDAFQHRYVTPSLSILVTDYNRLFYKDKVMPFGRLRESKKNMRRANIVVVSKCAEDIRPIDFRIIENEIELQPYQSLYFTRIIYGKVSPVFPVNDGGGGMPDATLPNAGREALVLAGIASPALFIKEARKRFGKVSALVFPDHHAFNGCDIRRIQEAFARMDSPGKFILVTEKDAARLLHNPLVPDEWKQLLYYLPIRIDFCKEDTLPFDSRVKEHVATFRRNNIHI
jgi:tetraacyldisaccharide 4'-kinase